MKINIEAAKKYLGVPYVWGGESLSEGGFDCSGLACNVFNDSGITVSRLTAQKYYEKFKEYEKPKNTTPLTGDVLFFGKSTKSISHIAFAVDSKKMIESVGTSKNTIKNKGKGVSINYISRRKDLVAIIRFTENVSRETSLVVPPETPILKRGSVGTSVQNLQKLLNRYFLAKLECDGIFGEKTYKALRDMQAASGIMADGKYGKHTRRIFMNLVR